MRLVDIQRMMRKEYYNRDMERGVYGTFTWFVEEVGELAEALLSNDNEKIMEETADVLAWLVSIANLKNIDLEDALRKKYPFLNQVRE